MMSVERWRGASLIIARLSFSCCHCANGNRYLSSGSETVEELMEKHAMKTERSPERKYEISDRRRLTVAGREALSLYRDILRASRFFMWPDGRGVLWRDVLRVNARKEFEEARPETDPEIVTRLIIGGRDALQSAIDKLAEEQRQQIEKERLRNESRF